MDKRKDLIKNITEKLYQIQSMEFLNVVYQVVKVFANKSQNKGGEF